MNYKKIVHKDNTKSKKKKVWLSCNNADLKCSYVIKSVTCLLISLQAGRYDREDPAGADVQHWSQPEAAVGVNHRGPWQPGNPVSIVFFARGATYICFLKLKY